MPKYSKQKASEKTQIEADRIASHIQKTGQSKEQTKLVSQGIQKGIALYKKQQKAKARELDKKLKKASSTGIEKEESSAPAKVQGKNQWLPWSLLVLSWLSFGLICWVSTKV